MLKLPAVTSTSTITFGLTRRKSSLPSPSERKSSRLRVAPLRMLNPSSEAPSSPSLETSSTDPLRRSTCGPSADSVATEVSPTMRTLRPIARTEMRSTPPVLTGLVPARAGSSSLASGLVVRELGPASGWSVTAAQGSESAVDPASSSFVGSEELWEVPCVAFKASMRRAASAASMRPAARSSRMGVMSGVVMRRM